MAEVVNTCKCCGGIDQVDPAIGHCIDCSPRSDRCPECRACDLCCECDDYYEDDE